MRVTLLKKKLYREGEGIGILYASHIITSQGQPYPGTPKKNARGAGQGTPGLRDGRNEQKLERGGKNCTEQRGIGEPQNGKRHK